jgi:flagellin
MSDVVLNAALRSNLSSLQLTQSLIDVTQQRLSTGKKVNSALDNPQNFFAAQSLSNRASDLSRLLDGIGQSISTIQAADEGITGLTSLIEQADSLANSALEASSSAATSARVTGNVSLTSYEHSDGAGSISFNFTDSNGKAIDVADVDAGGSVFSVSGTTVSFTLADGNTINDIINNINKLEDTDGNKLVQAKLTDGGFLEIGTLVTGTNARVAIKDDTGQTESATLAGKLGFSNQAVNTSTPVDAVAFNIQASAAVSSGALYKSSTEIADRSTTLDGLLRAAGADGTVDDEVLTLTANAGDTHFINVGVNGGSARSFEVTTTTTVQQFIDAINNDAALNSQIEASFDENTGQLTFSALSGSVTSIEFSTTGTEGGAGGGATQTAIDFGFGSGGALTSAAAGDGLTTTSSVETVLFGAGGGDIAQSQKDFNKVLAQIDALVADSGYRGVNLLNGDDLVTTFNEDRTNQLTTEGGDFTSSGLGISQAAFSTTNNINTSLTQVRAALESVRAFGSSIANDLAIMQTREDFTKGMIDELDEGADKLTIADQNEEAANLLALQTRQQLGVTALSLAAQSQQAVLRLF